MQQQPIDAIRAAIEQYTGRSGRQHGNSYQLNCPAHPDRAPSLSLTENPEHHALLHCHAGCSTDEILAAIGKTRRDLYPVRDGDRRRDPIVASYRYVDENGHLLFEVERTVEKRFYQRRPDPDNPAGWIHNLDGVRRVLYRLPQVLQAIHDHQTIYLVEGEKDVHTAEHLGHVATTNPGGAGKWRPEYTETLRGAHVVIIADNDQSGVGLAHARTVGYALSKVTASLIIGVPTVGKDLTDLVTAGLGVDDITVVTLTVVETETTQPGLPDPTDTRTVPPQRDRSQTEPVDDTGASRVRLTPATAFRPRAARWVWATPEIHSGWLALGELTLIAGREGVGKSTLLAWIAGQITQGTLPGIYQGTPKTVLYAASEDSWAYTIVPRMIAAGADLSRVYRIDIEEDGLLRGLSLPRDVRTLPDVARETDAAVLMCDPILSLVDGSINPNHSKELRRALEPLRASAEEAGLAIPALAHFNKTRDVDGLSMVAGSRAWVEVARSAMLLAWDDNAGHIVVTQAKNNLGRRQEQSRTYNLVDTVVESEDGDIHIGRVSWGDQTNTSAETVLQRRPPEEGRAAGDVDQQVLRALSDAQGRHRSPHQIAEATGINHSTVRTALRRLAATGQVQVIRTGVYGLPATADVCVVCRQPMIRVDESNTHPTCTPPNGHHR